MAMRGHRRASVPTAISELLSTAKFDWSQYALLHDATDYGALTVSMGLLTPRTFFFATCV